MSSVEREWTLSLVSIPGWVRGGDGGGGTVLYRVEVALRPPREEPASDAPPGPGELRTYEVLHRFSDFLRLHKALKESFPRKRLPTPPAKKLLSNVNASPALIGERRGELEEWIRLLVEDADVASAPGLGAFLELGLGTRKATAKPVPSPAPWGGGGPAEVAPCPSGAGELGDGGGRGGGGLEARLTEARADLEVAESRLLAEAATSSLLAGEVKELEGRVEQVREEGAEAMRHAMAKEQEARNAVLFELEEERAAAAAARDEVHAMAAAREAEGQRADAADLRREEAAAAALEAEAALASEREEAKEARAVHKQEKRLLRQEVLNLRNQLSSTEAAHSTAVDSARAEAEAAAAAAASRQEQQLLREVAALREKLRDCAMEKMAAEEDGAEAGAVDTERALEVLAASDGRVQCLLAEAQLLAQADGSGDGGGLRRAFAEVLMDAAQLRKNTNGMLRSALLVGQGEGAGEESPASGGAAGWGLGLLSYFSSGG